MSKDASELKNMSEIREFINEQLEEMQDDDDMDVLFDEDDDEEDD